MRRVSKGKKATVIPEKLFHSNRTLEKKVGGWGLKPLFLTVFID